MRLVLDTSAAANIVLGTADGVRLADVVEQADWVIAPGLLTSDRKLQALLPRIDPALCI